MLEEIDLRLAIQIGPCQKTSRAWAGARRYRHTAVSAVRAKAPSVFTKGQDGTLGV